MPRLRDRGGLLAVLKQQVPDLVVETLELALDEFETEEEAAAWVEQQGFDAGDVTETADGYVFRQREEVEFLEGSLRKIGDVADGVTATVGIPIVEKALRKGDGSEPEFSLSDLTHLEDLEIYEVTLTRSPAVGAMAHFQIFKSIDRPKQLPVRKRFAIAKTDSARKQIWGYALVPDLPDLQADVVSAETIREAASSFLKSAFLDRAQKGSGIGEEHQVFDGVGYPIDSFYDEHGVFGVAGGWWLGVQVTDDEVWKAVEDGEIKGFSIGGTGVRRQVEEVSLKSRQLMAIELSKSEFSKEQAIAWLARHDYRTEQIVELEKTWRIGQTDAELLACGSVDLTPGVMAQLGMSPVQKTDTNDHITRTDEMDEETKNEGEDGVEKACTVDELRYRVCQQLNALHPSSWPWIVALFVDRVVYELEPYDYWSRSLVITESDEVELGEAVQVSMEWTEAEKTLKKHQLVHEGGPRPEKVARKSLARRVSDFVGRLFTTNQEEIDMDTKELEKRLEAHRDDVAKHVVDQVGEMLSKQLPQGFPAALLEAQLGDSKTDRSEGAKILNVIELANKMVAEGEEQFGESDTGPALGFVLEGLHDGQQQLAKALTDVAEAVKALGERKPMRKSLDLDVSGLLAVKPAEPTEPTEPNGEVITKAADPEKSPYRPHPLYGYNGPPR